MSRDNVTFFSHEVILKLIFVNILTFRIYKLYHFNDVILYRQFFIISRIFSLGYKDAKKLFYLQDTNFFDYINVTISYVTLLNKYLRMW